MAKKTSSKKDTPEQRLAKTQPEALLNEIKAERLELASFIRESDKERRKPATTICNDVGGSFTTKTTKSGKAKDQCMIGDTKIDAKQLVLYNAFRHELTDQFWQKEKATYLQNIDIYKKHPYMRWITREEAKLAFNRFQGEFVVIDMLFFYMIEAEHVAMAMRYIEENIAEWSDAMRVFKGTKSIAFAHVLRALAMKNDARIYPILAILDPKKSK
jgi:hypothetical protein